MRTALKLALSLLLLIACRVAYAATQGPSTPSCAILYQNHNQIDYGPLKMRTVSGRVVDVFHEDAVPGACAGLFTEGGHELVAVWRTDDKGLFHFDRIPDGRYRLVVELEPFCAANIPILVTARSRAKKRVRVIFRPPGLDSCSYGELEASSEG